MHMMKSSEQLSHVVFSHLLAENLVLLLSNLLEQLSTPNVLHDEVDILLIHISFIIFYNIRVIQFSENSHFFLNCFEVIFQLVFIQNFDRHLVTSVVLVVSQEDLAECA